MKQGRAAFGALEWVNSVLVTLKKPRISFGTIVRRLHLRHCQVPQAGKMQARRVSLASPARPNSGFLRFRGLLSRPCHLLRATVTQIHKI